MTDEELKAIEARADACFRGPWTATTFTVECDSCPPDDCRRCAGEGEAEIERIESPDEYPDGQVVADVPGMECFSQPHAAFIAAARDDVPALVAEVRRLRGEYERGWNNCRAAAEKAITEAFERDEDVAAIDVVRALVATQPTAPSAPLLCCADWPSCTCAHTGRGPRPSPTAPTCATCGARCGGEICECGPDCSTGGTVRL